MKGFFIGRVGKRLLLLLGISFTLSQLDLGGWPVFSEEEPQTVLYDAKGHRDPFVPLVRDGRIVNPRAASGILPVLYGILWDPDGRSMALINDREVSVGDQVGAYRVEEIQPDAVVLADEGGERVVLGLAYESFDPLDEANAVTGGTP